MDCRGSSDCAEYNKSRSINPCDEEFGAWSRQRRLQMMRIPPNGSARRASAVAQPPGAERGTSRCPATLAGLVLGLAFFTGCTTSLRQWACQGFKVGPEYAGSAAPVGDQWIEASDSRLDTNPTDGDSWWSVFNDPILDGLIATASQQNLELQEAGERVLEARARLAIARGSLLPQVQEAFGSFTRTQMSRTTAKPIKQPFFDDWATGFNASWELDFWGRFRRGVEASEATLEATVEDCHDVLVILQAEVAASYIQVRVLQERIELARRNVELQRQTLALAEFRFDEGKTTKLDVTQAQEILATTQALIPQLEIALRESQNALCVLLGIPPRDLEAELATGPIPQPPREVAVGIPSQLLARRPDVRQAERQVAAQSARIGIAESELYPRIAITGTIGYESQDLSSLFQTDSFMGSVGPGFRWNILNYGRLVNNVRAEEARFRQLVRNYQGIVLKAHEEVENGIVRFLREQDRRGFLEKGATASAESVELAESQYREGKTDFQRLMDSQRALVLLQDRLSATRGQVALELVAIYKALGGGWQTQYPSSLYGQTVESAAAVEPPAAP